MPAAKAQEAEPTTPTMAKQEEQFLAWVNGEIEKLESVENRLAHFKSLRAALTGEVITLPTATGGTRRRGGERKKDRLAEFVGIVSEHPGITISEAAKLMGAAPNYLYRLKTRGLAENLIRVDGSNVFPAEGVEATPAAA